MSVLTKLALTVFSCSKCIDISVPNTIPITKDRSSLKQNKNIEWNAEV
jgi:hypothetical protein